ncbi:mucin-binding protein, partial [Limosilactobacillus allomucosae]|uniref:mucin-binding protein n=1 Tax=Limosilactobacillus allomucosae TaxID=3142938 RepID=UPI0032644B5F
YAPDTQKAAVTYIDQTTGKTLTVKNLTGYTLEDTGYNTTNDIKHYVDNGYDLVGDTSNSDEIIFDDEDGVDQTYTVTLKHGVATINETNPGKPGQPINSDKTGVKWPAGTDKASLGKDVVRTIVYKATDGSAVPASVKDTLHFTAVKTVDKATGQVLTTVWSGTQSFNDVTTPNIKGYTSDQAVISDKGITYEHSNIDEVVTYVPDAQKATVTYYDDTTGKVLKSVSLKGVTHADSDYTTQDAINGYVNLGYKLVSDSTNGKSVVFDNEDDKDQVFSVHLAHDYATVTSDMDKKVGTPINKDANGAKWPEGSAKSALQDDVMRNITYVVVNGKKSAPASVNDSLHYEAAATVDKVTGQVVKTVWSAPQDFKEIVSPALKGYTADKKSISDKNVAHDHADIKEVVTYAPDTQKAAVTYIDQTTGKTLTVKNLTGYTLEDTGYNTKSAIDAYKNLGYNLVSDDTNGAEIIFDDDDTTDQAYKVVLAHGFAVVTPGDNVTEGNPINPDKNGAKWPVGATKSALTHDVKRNVTYVIANGKKSAPASVNDSLHYEAAATVDKVTGQVVKTVWSAPQDFKDVATPAVKGYTADKKSISDKNVAHDHADIKEVVTYAPDTQKAAVTYIDQTTGKTLTVKNLTGYTLEDTGYNTKSAIDAYKNLGYDLVSDDTNGAEIIFDDDDTADQAYTVVFKHGTTDVSEKTPGKPGEPINPGKGSAVYPEGTDKTGLGKDVVRTIVYKATDGSAGPASVKDVLHFTAVKTVDKVTGKVINTVWSDDQDFKDVVTPSVKGYTPDQAVISDKGITYKHSNIDEVVTYVPDAQKATVTYYDDTTGKVLKSVSLKGVTHADSGYTTQDAINGYVNLGYKLVSDGTNGKSVVFDNEDDKDQVFSVHLAHDYATVTSDMDKKVGTPINKDANGAKWPEGSTKSALQDDVKRNITYVIANGKKTAPASVNDSLHYEATATVDKVTGQVVKTVWSAPQDFKEIASPTVKGYTADKKSISDKNVAHDHADIKEVVTYAPDTQKAAVTYIDQTTGKTLAVKNLTGYTLEDTGYNTKSAIDGYVSLGYDLVSDSSKGAEIVFDDDDAADQAYTVVFKHGTTDVSEKTPGKPGEPINPGKGSAVYPEGTDKASLGSDVKRTITYKMSDGSKAPDPVHDSLSYNATKVIDKVTGAVIKTDWSQNQDFKDVTSPEQTGYTADKQVVSNHNVAHDADDINVVVTYTADDQKATVTYIDDTTHKTLKTKPLSGKTNAKSGYTTAKDIQDYKDLGYVLVSDSTNGAKIVFDNDDTKDQAFEVHLKHGTMPVSETDTVTETIHYRYADGKPAQPDKVQILTIIKKGIKDLVNGNIVWQPVDSQMFASVQTPAISGYQANVASVPEQTVKFGDHDIEYVVTYYKVAESTPSKQKNDLQGTTGTHNEQANTSVDVDQKATSNQTQMLPQTGNEQTNNVAGIVGLALTTLGTLLGLGKKKRRE